ncbi:MAG TPA: hypothetical protein VLN26_05215, partial [Gaiellaceae bacterium]|nr:hypothetical protein [Gaiellaceae bacterium]
RARGQARGREAARARKEPSMTHPEQYVAAAYLVVFGVVLAWVLIMTTKLRRLEQRLQELDD